MKRWLLLLLLAIPAYGQQFYIMPLTQQQVTTKKGVVTRTLPAYVSLLAKGEQWQQMPLGAEPLCLFAAMSPTPAETAAISASPGVITIPSDLTLIMTITDAANMNAALNALNLPGGWVQPGNTWAAFLHKMMALMQFVQRFNGVATGNGDNPYLFVGTGYTPLTLVSALPAAMMTDLTQAATSLNYSMPPTPMLNAMNLGQLLQYLAVQWPIQNPIQFAGMQF